MKQLLWYLFPWLLRNKILNILPRRSWSEVREIRMFFRERYGHTLEIRTIELCLRKLIREDKVEKNVLGYFSIEAPGYRLKKFKDKDEPPPISTKCYCV